MKKKFLILFLSYAQLIYIFLPSFTLKVYDRISHWNGVSDLKNTQRDSEERFLAYHTLGCSKNNYNSEGSKFIDRNVSFSPNSPLKLNVKTMSGRIIHLEDVDQNDSIAQLKKKIESKDGMPANEQRLIVNGKQLEDHMRIKDYNLKEDTPLQLVLRLKGGL